MFLVLAGLVFLIGTSQKSPAAEARQETSLEDAKADARRWVDRLSSQVLTLSGTDAASTQALADASERYNSAFAALGEATTVRQAELARESALEGLYYVNAAREIMGMPAGPELPPLEGQRAAGRVTERRTIEHEGQTITASPHASSETPNYYPGGRVAGRPVPAGWYSTAWWAPALMTGMWAAGSVMLFSSLFAGMAGVHYGAEAFAAGPEGMDGDGFDAADTGYDGMDGDYGDADFDGGDMDFGDFGGDFDFGGFDF